MYDFDQTTNARHPERSEGPRLNCERHPNVYWVINHLLRGPSPSARLGMTGIRAL